MSDTVKFCKYVLLLLGVLSFRIAIADTGQQLEGLTIIDSEFYGSGSENSNYVIRASESNQISINTHRLKRIVMVYDSVDKKNSLYVSAAKGIFNSDDEILDLYEDIVVKFNKNYQLFTDKIKINFGTTLVSSEDMTEIKGISERITSKTGFAANIKEKIVDFHGPITTILIRK